MDRNDLTANLTDSGNVKGASPPAGNLPRSTIWPELTEIQAGEADAPLVWNSLETARQAVSVVQGVNAETATRIQQVMEENETLRWQLTVGTQPAGQTSADSLTALKQTQRGMPERLEVRLVLPAQLHEQWPYQNLTLVETDEGVWMAWIGSSPSLGVDVPVEPYLNLWFRMQGNVYAEANEFVRAMAAIAVPLTDNALTMPFLIPAEGTEEARRMWEDYQKLLLTKRGAVGQPLRTVDSLVIDPEQGLLVRTEEGKLVPAPPMVAEPPRDPLSERIAEIFEQCDLVIVGKPIVPPTSCPMPSFRSSESGQPRMSPLPPGWAASPASCQSGAARASWRPSGAASRASRHSRRPASAARCSSGRSSRSGRKRQF